MVSDNVYVGYAPFCWHLALFRLLAENNSFMVLGVSPGELTDGDPISGPTVVFLLKMICI